MTNSRGDFVAVGLGGDFLKITYNDGTADRALPDFLRSVPGNRVELPTAPYVTVPAMKTVATPNAAGPVVVDAWAASSSAGARTVAGSKQTGVQVTLLPPRGAATNVKGQCTAVLTAVTNTSGKATLRVCATKSGTFQVRAKGAMTSGSLTLLVKGKPALPPRSARAKSVRPGAAVVSWVKPFYSGGTDVTGYRIVVSSPGKPTRVNFLKVFNPSTKLAVAFDGLAHAKMYTVQIVAITKYGSSDPATTTVPVA